MKTMFGLNSVLETVFGTKYELEAVGENCVIKNVKIIRPIYTKYWEGPLLGTLKDM
jgi:hypothetical protein